MSMSIYHSEIDKEIIVLCVSPRYQSYTHYTRVGVIYRLDHPIDIAQLPNFKLVKPIDGHWLIAVYSNSYANRQAGINNPDLPSIDDI